MLRFYVTINQLTQQAGDHENAYVECIAIGAEQVRVYPAPAWLLQGEKKTPRFLITPPGVLPGVICF